MRQALLTREQRREYINNGKQSGVDVACKISDALGVPIEELMEI